MSVRKNVEKKCLSVSGSLCALSGMLATGLPIPIIANNFNIFYNYSRVREKLQKRLSRARKSINIRTSSHNLIKRVNGVFSREQSRSNSSESEGAYKTDSPIEKANDEFENDHSRPAQPFQQDSMDQELWKSGALGSATPDTMIDYNSLGPSPPYPNGNSDLPVEVVDEKMESSEEMQGNDSGLSKSSSEDSGDGHNKQCDEESIYDEKDEFEKRTLTKTMSNEISRIPRRGPMIKQGSLDSSRSPYARVKSEELNGILKKSFSSLDLNGEEGPPKMYQDRARNSSIAGPPAMDTHRKVTDILRDQIIQKHYYPSAQKKGFGPKNILKSSISFPLLFPPGSPKKKHNTGSESKQQSVTFKLS